nr:Chain E, GLN-ALA-SER-GLN-GLU-VAL-LYS-ASN-TRP [synthetic construct]5IM7_F Chain F, GLN-ALA-SER-GLN-GLU-VAL-LYS-ASN-TRP [synthetic construct]7R7V_C Chain C, GLN-ALA-SER-GLN-GLU-VAL-LYS-ASN-TRP [HIV-1 06TG.HT008]7R7X_E Chain E, GLN-ALA-SER-GLN-GLU-VAL-LYS-ASN-TRP [HIV-1 06TG.HT008]7R7X_F Chain F, GLN-ALA-SER-GLN-GLU-VAL-LYS-ASN-TRP [HIV-1 06TG.HT008]7R80_E Chain E, GLN-ALA-SER-GLN-GLU-VAL-LYS-ASN-TRP [HIV-1 06TG.HT008]
QASQEVKNW